MANLWSGRFSKSMDQITSEYNASIGFDHTLYNYSILGSMAHVTMLQKQEIIDDNTASKIINGLKIIKERLDNGEVTYDPADEDIMMTIERLLIEEIGDPGRAVHTARSRNDQSVLDTTLYLRQTLIDTMSVTGKLLDVLIQSAEDNIDIIMPGFTHVQHAQPITVGYYFMAHFQNLKADAQRMIELMARVNENPLGSCAMAGTTLPIDRHITSELLGFDRPTENAMRTIGNRDNIIEYLFIAALAMTHISQLCEELVIFNSQEFNYIYIDDAFATGSSIMPQKKNPDIAELARGKVGRTFGNLVSVLTTVKGTFLTYNKDYQEDKEPLFDSAKTLVDTIYIFADMLESISFNKKSLNKHLGHGFLESTDIAEFLVTHGIPFRTAHEIVGTLVKYCENNNMTFSDIKKKDLKELEFPVDIDDLSQFTIENSVKIRDSYGSTSASDVKRQIKNGKSFVEKLQAEINEYQHMLNVVYNRF